MPIIVLVVYISMVYIFRTSLINTSHIIPSGWQFLFSFIMDIKRNSFLVTHLWMLLWVHTEIFAVESSLSAKCFWRIDVPFLFISCINDGYYRRVNIIIYEGSLLDIGRLLYFNTPLYLDLLRTNGIANCWCCLPH